MANVAFRGLFREGITLYWAILPSHPSPCGHIPTPSHQTAFSQRPTLGLKAMSFRIISTVKRPVKSMLRIFMAILKRQLWP